MRLEKLNIPPITTNIMHTFEKNYVLANDILTSSCSHILVFRNSTFN